MASRSTPTGWAALFLLSTGCTFNGAAEARASPPHAAYRAAGSQRLNVRIDAPSPERAQAIEQGLNTALGILASEEFLAVLRKEKLRADPASKLGSTGGEVETFFAKNLPESIVFLERPQGIGGLLGVGDTTATTDAVNAVISVSPARVDAWMEGRSGLLVNTLAHELTHLNASYLDGDRKDCHEATLVSYRVGDLAQCFYEAKGDRLELHACITTMTNGSPDRAKRLRECDDVVSVGVSTR